MLAAHFELVQVLSAIYAAVVLGAVNFAIAAILFAVAARPPKARELGLATEIHGTSVAAARSARCNRSCPDACAARAADHDHHQKSGEAGRFSVCPG